MHGLFTLSLILIAVVESSAASEFCSTVYADYHRRQLAYFSEDGVFDIESGAKHVPVLTLSEDGSTATIVVGNGDEEDGVWHPMIASDDPSTVHFITHIMVKDQNDNVIAAKALDPTIEGPATVTIDVPAGATELTPYEWCNIHGLWVGETVPIPTTTAEARSTTECEVSQYPEGAWESVHADFLRQQKETYQSDTPFKEEDGVKHIPYITLNEDGVTGSIIVGVEPDPVHPMIGSVDGITDPHWITEVYVVDADTGKIITMKSLDPTGVDAATMEFDIPTGTESIVAYEWCNIHGLWESPKVETPTTAAAASSDTSSSATDGGTSSTNGACSTTTTTAALGTAAAIVVANV